MMPPKTKPTPKAADQTSWADRVRISDSSTRFTLENLARQPIGHRLKVSEAMLLENSDQWSRCMVGFFPGYKMPYHAVNKIASRVWKQCGLELVTATANGFMIFRFNTEENMHSVLEKGPWMFGGKNIILQQWHPRFRFDKNKISTLPVWIRLHGLPFPLWSKQGLSLAASMIGRPLSCDEQTYNCTRLEYARVCVEIDAALPYVQNFEIDSPLLAEPITVTVDYEWKPSRCEKCHVFGHSCLSIAATQPTSMDKGKGIAELASQANTNPSLPIPQDPPLTSADPSSSNVPLPTIPCITTHIAITTTTDPPSPSLPSSPTTHCPPPSLDPQPIPNTIPISSPSNPSPITLPAVPHAQPDLHIPGNEADTFHQAMPHVVLDNAPCQESKMASLSTTSESSQTATTATTETFSNFIANDDASPSSWNTWGLNSLQKQNTVHDWTQKNNLDIFGLLETKIEVTNLAAVQANLAPSCWHFLSNTHHTSHCRILVDWNSQKHNLIYEDSSPQWLSCKVITTSSTQPLKLTFIYGHNTPSERTLLWNYLCQTSIQNIDTPWIVMGDFNAILTAADRVGGDTNWYHHQDDFSNCIRQSELITLPYTGLRFTWHNGQHGDHTIQKKLDWILGNQCLFSTWPRAHSVFQPRNISDHSAMLIHLQTDSYRRQIPFKFLNLWADREDFLSTVSSSWQEQISGNPIYQFTSKLRLLKLKLKNFHQQHTSNITSRVSQAQSAWYAAQIILDADPTSSVARTNERSLAHQYMQLCKDEESFFQQRSKIQWLQLGDRNTKFFHKSLLHRQVRNKIHHLTDNAGNIIQDQQKMSQMAVSFFEQLLAPTPQPPLQDDITLLYPKPISDASKTAMLLPLTNDEIKVALFSIPDNKAPGPDGYNAFFFKKCWHIIGTDFIAATRYFFTNNSLPRCVNATRVALVPKVENPSSMNDFRPISCCNILYKCISKIIVSRLKSVLNDIIGPAQSAFLPGRSISDAILLTQELMHNSHLSNGPSNCALKIDLRKAFDTVSWEFILAGLTTIALPQCMINWIKICISTAHYTINMNGELHGFFKSTRGLRQGDPLSPYLFVFAMEGLGGLLRNATQNTTFKYHWQCKQNSITHLCFADDLMLFCNADTTSVGILKSCLDKFSQLSGLNINHAKSFLYLFGVNRDLHHEIQQQIGFQ
ncbi:hypothetical protein NC653_000138 [Populus alba x Populus x berolinensis]|uniref:Reverse transcriptase domain-containing protein n=1 Tax=Populus alba x Populus x berolinensis TaxID=444605 RepID=A0AAD6RHZ1_9ROSI|nr:hypothetical protein NC653_000138 [Populus alba x Populus x berolinensis]